MRSISLNNWLKNDSSNVILGEAKDLNLLRFK